MEFEGTVVQVLPAVKGVSARGEWTKQEVIIEQSGEFGRKVCVSFWGDKAQDALSLRPGDAVSVSVNVESREHNGRWYTEVRAWKLQKRAGGDAPAAAANTPSGGYSQMPAPSAGDEPMAAAKEDYDDLPF